MISLPGRRVDVQVASGTKTNCCAGDFLFNTWALFWSEHAATQPSLCLSPSPPPRFSLLSLCL